jgi:hypothetical protein
MFIEGNERINIFEPYELIEGEFDAETGYLMNGHFRFSFDSWHRPDRPWRPSEITVSEGIVDTISLVMGEFRTLREVIDALSTPDRVTFFHDASLYEFRLLYSRARLKVQVTAGDLASSDECNLLTVSENFWVDLVTYYSPVAALEPYNALDIDQPQPAMWGYILGERDVLLETFESWLNGEIEATCLEAWESLPEEIVLPTIPSPTATPPSN